MTAAGSATGTAARSQAASNADPPGGASPGRTRSTSAAATAPARRRGRRRAPASASTPSARTRSRSRPPRRSPASGNRTPGVRTGLIVPSISATAPRCGRSPAGSSGRPSSSSATRPAIRADTARRRTSPSRTRPQRGKRRLPSRAPAATRRSRSGETAAVGRTHGRFAEKEIVSSRLSPISASAARGQSRRCASAVWRFTGTWSAAAPCRSARRALRGRAAGGRRRRGTRHRECGRRRRSRPGTGRTRGFRSRPRAGRSSR